MMFNVLRLEREKGVNDERHHEHECDNALDPKHERRMVRTHSAAPHQYVSRATTQPSITV